MKTLLISLFASFLPFVNPFVGTGGHGHTFPGATYPFGMVQLSPDTRLSPSEWDGCSGYHYSDSLIYGFSHTHLSGTGCSDLCDILMMPVVDYSHDTIDPQYYCSSFSHSDEKASPGYYEVLLKDSGVLAQFTVGRRSGYHKYTFPKKATAQLVVDLSHRDYLQDYAMLHDKYTLCGYRESSSWAQNQKIFFFAQFSHPIKSFRKEGPRALITFKAPKGAQIRVRVGISGVSAQGARENLAMDGLSFDMALAGTRFEWESFLSTLKCPQGVPQDVFYTALYHSAIHPSLWSDADGLYRGMDGKIHKADGWEQYTIFSLWDTYRGLHPLLCQIAPAQTLDFLKSFLSIYSQAGKLPVWELHGFETNCMIGFHSAPVFAHALSCGLTDFDVPLALDALVASTRVSEAGLQSFFENGVVLAQDDCESVSKTLEYSYDCWCVAQVAKWLLENPGRHNAAVQDLQKIYDVYMRYAQCWRNSFDPSTGFMRPRSNGCWLSPFEPRHVNNHYTEANSWQYSFYVPQDVVGLMRLHGGPKGFIAKLDSLFDAPAQTTGRVQQDITGQIGQYAHGNEPSQHIPYLYALAGDPQKGQQKVEQIMSTLYFNAPDGICGNDDCGQTSAWYVLSAIGEYPVCPGVSVGTVTYIPKTLVVSPVFQMEDYAFREDVCVGIDNIDALCNAYYRIVPDGEDADQIPYILYTEPFKVACNATLQTYAMNQYGQRSFVTSSKVRKILQDVSVTLISTPHHLYADGGSDTLIDSRSGNANWRTGGFLGFEGCNVELVVDMSYVRSIDYVGANFCQDVGNWIWMPSSVDYEISEDGINYTHYATVDSKVAKEKEGVILSAFETSPSQPVRARYIKMKATNIGLIPSWHPGAGLDAFIFMDEIWFSEVK